LKIDGDNKIGEASQFKINKGIVSITKSLGSLTPQNKTRDSKHKTHFPQEEYIETPQVNHQPNCEFNS
jgi:hypothetical protein